MISCCNKNQFLLAIDISYTYNKFIHYDTIKDSIISIGHTTYTLPPRSH